MHVLEHTMAKTIPIQGKIFTHPTSPDKTLKDLEVRVKEIEEIVERHDLSELENLGATIDSFHTEIAMIRTQIHQQNQVIAEQDDKIAELTKRVAELEKIQNDLVFGQIVTKANKCIVERIIEGTQLSTEKSFITINMLWRAVNNERLWNQAPILKTPNEIEQAEHNWTRLDQEFSLDENVYGALDEYRLTRNITAHPRMTLADASRHIETNSSIEAKKKEMGLRLLKMLRDMSVTEI